MICTFLKMNLKQLVQNKHAIYRNIEVFFSKSKISSNEYNNSYGIFCYNGISLFRIAFVSHKN